MLSKQHGFTILEIAIVLFILLLIIGILLNPLAESIERNRRAETTQLLQFARDSLLAYTAINGNLPCPDCIDTEGNCADATLNDGQEDRVDIRGNSISHTHYKQCSAEFGNLPWATLALAENDAWGNPLLYRVDPDFADYGIDCYDEEDFENGGRAPDLGGTGPNHHTLRSLQCRAILSAHFEESDKDHCGNDPLQSDTRVGLSPAQCRNICRLAIGTKSCADDNLLYGSNVRDKTCRADFSKTPPGMSFCLASAADGDIDVYNETDNTLQPSGSAVGVPALIFSSGANEQINNRGIDIDNKEFFLSTDYSRRNADFDDLVLWISPDNLMYHLVKAGRLSFDN